MLLWQFLLAEREEMEFERTRGMVVRQPMAVPRASVESVAGRKERKLVKCFRYLHRTLLPFISVTLSLRDYGVGVACQPFGRAWHTNEQWSASEPDTARLALDYRIETGAILEIWRSWTESISVCDFAWNVLADRIFMLQLNSRIDGLLRVVAGWIFTEDRRGVHQSRRSNLGPATYLNTGTIPLHFNVCLHLHQHILNYQPSLLATPTRVHRVASTQITTF